MKRKFILLLVGLAFYSAATAQSKGPATLYAYEQSVAPGTQRQWSEGNTGKELSPGKNYFIYLVSSARAYPAKLWIRGVEYDVRIKTISETPVTLKNAVIPSAPAVELVPKTEKRVIQIIPAPSTTGKSFSEAASLARENEVVVVYKMNGKFYYESLTEIKPLTGTARQ